MIMDKQSFSINEKGHLEIGKVDTVELAAQYGTPLYVYDVEKIRANCRSFIETFRALGVDAQVAYASKALSIKAILEVMMEEGLSLDVVSQGELYTAIQAGFPPEKIHFHGNNKSEADLQMALDYQIGCIIVDNFYEIELLEKLLADRNERVDVLLRVTPGIESETHQYIMTGNEDSKFGFNLQNGQIDQAYARVKNHPHIHLRGLHSHIGSQIFTTKSFALAIEILFELIGTWHKEDGFVPEVMNFGGGFGIMYTKEDNPTPNEQHVESIVQTVKKEVERLQLPMPEIWLEPGRSIVGDAGITLYTVGAMKDIPGVRQYVSVDGGMADNIRPALYQAKYDAFLANKANAALADEVSIAGKCCESGDMLIWDLPLAEVEHDDILAIFSTGAYGYAMASNYNKFQKPAVVFVENKEAALVVKRESLDDLIQHELSYTKR